MTTGWEVLERFLSLIKNRIKQRVLMLTFKDILSGGLAAAWTHEAIGLGMQVNILRMMEW